MTKWERQDMTMRERRDMTTWERRAMKAWQRPAMTKWGRQDITNKSWLGPPSRRRALANQGQGGCSWGEHAL
jgi:hypothetical protein